MQYQRIVNEIKSAKEKIRFEHPEIYRHIKQGSHEDLIKKANNYSKKYLKEYLGTLKRIMHSHTRKRYIGIS
ncbi:hypothetical protein [Flexithrix dorotheae]|uniref:hypothetical protein n=1 Tax=Flexithrix dorotheae TaxID=70993 RepID=UPI00037C2FA4|nr:hypothetical protein [Flexithrix dorotheae]